MIYHQSIGVPFNGTLGINGLSVMTVYSSHDSKIVNMLSVRECYGIDTVIFILSSLLLLCISCI